MEPDTQQSSNNAPSDQGSTDEANDANASEITETNQEDTPSFGWNRYAELINGRFAMIGFVALLVLELVTRQDFFTWLGI